MANSVVYKPLVADGVINKPLVNDSICHQRLVNGDPRKPLRVCKGRSMYATKGMYTLLVAYVDRRVHAIGSIRGSSFASLWWLTWIAVHKPLVAVGVLYKPLVAYVGRRVQAFWWRTWIVM